MDDVRTGYAGRAGTREAVSTATLLGQVMFLVAVALAFTVAGTYIGRELTRRHRVHPVPRRLRDAARPELRRAAARRHARHLLAVRDRAAASASGSARRSSYLVENDPSTVTQAAGATALITLGMGAGGFALSKDISGWMRPLSYVILGCVVVSFAMLLFSSGGNPILSAIIAIVSALLIAVDFNYLRKHGTADDAIWLATGIFVSIINIFLSLLNLFSD